jgi:hypothetical protein
MPFPVTDAAAVAPDDVTEAPELIEYVIDAIADPLDPPDAGDAERLTTTGLVLPYPLTFGAGETETTATVGRDESSTTVTGCNDARPAVQLPKTAVTL